MNTDSPTCWNAVFNIALTALEMDAEYRATVHYAAGADGTSYESSEVGYADDLVSLHDTATEIQRKAEVMSAFCVICGVTMSHKKLRRAVQDWLGVRHLPSDFSMKIYEYGWTARDITVKIDGATEFLGGQHDLITIGSTQEVSALDVTRQHCNVIDRTYASGTTKLMCLSVSTVPKILYKHNLNSISLNRYQKTDKICYPVILSACKHLWGFPKALLHLPPSHLPKEMGHFTVSTTLGWSPGKGSGGPPSSCGSFSRNSSGWKSRNHTSTTPINSKRTILVGLWHPRMGSHLWRTTMQEGRTRQPRHLSTTSSATTEGALEHSSRHANRTIGRSN